MITAREWRQDFEWAFHQTIALKAEVAKEIAEAIADGRGPAGMSADEEMIYGCSTELLRTKRVSDLTFNRLKARFGTKRWWTSPPLPGGTPFWP